MDQISSYGEIAPVGKVKPGDSVQVWSHDNDRVANRSEPADMHVCCGSIIKHYLGGVHEDSFYEDDHGRWFKTGDLGMINEDGIVYILGRMKDVIKRAGVPIIPAALESCIEKFTGSQVSSHVLSVLCACVWINSKCGY